jgi:hypothetical protein
MIDIRPSITLWRKLANEPARAEALTLAGPSPPVTTASQRPVKLRYRPYGVRGCPPPSKRPRDRLEVCYRPYGVRGCPPPSPPSPSPRPQVGLDRGTIATPCQRPEKVTLRSVPRTAARRTIVTTARETRGRLLPTTYYLHLEACYDRRRTPRLAGRSLALPEGQGAVYHYLDTCYTCTCYTKHRHTRSPPK